MFSAVNKIIVHLYIIVNTIMEQLFEKHLQKMINTDLDFVRSLTDDINWDARLVGIKGARGVGKTTLMLQYIKKSYNFV